ncbi:MAG: formate dehydrogenase accessory sulfurtransferase FdhD [Clostridia bacterium]|nr:formate dehydrogenase accessory sulfurtransferase FdhD [Clostridia bacterium]MDD4799237.1 formate dehydrogenase accessory sulfurtransferase FdhD [Clostridia bacterium]
MLATKSYPITRIDKGQRLELEDIVTREYSLELCIGKKPFARLLCSPDSLPVLITGYLFGEGIINGVEDILSLELDEQAGCAYLRLSAEAEKRALTDSVKTLTTGLGPQKSLIYALERLPGGKSGASNLTLKADLILSRAADFQSRSELFAATGGVHSCSLCDQSGVIYFYEDIGRHNVFDKLIGRGLSDNIDFSKTFIVTSGRIPGYMVLKAARAGISVIVSRAAVTDAAICLAKEANITLCGFARGERLNIYTGAERII